MKIYNNISRLRASSSASTDGSQQQQRANQLGEMIVSSLRPDQYAAEGAMFTASNATVGTAVALLPAAQIVYTATTPAFLIKNSDSVGGKDIILKRLAMTVLTAGTALTSLDCAVVVDSTNRYTSGGVPVTPINTRADQSNASVANIYQGSVAIVSPAASATTRVVARRRLRSQIPVISDQFVLNFGAESVSESGSVGSTIATLSSVNIAPVVIPPQCFALVYFWGAAMSASPTVEWTLEHVER